LTKTLLLMLKARCGQVVFINSRSGIVARPMSAQYDLTKHALKAIADSLRGEVNRDGVRVLSVYDLSEEISGSSSCPTCEA
jgi:short-subunit dehydrogenase